MKRGKRKMDLVKMNNQISMITNAIYRNDRETIKRISADIKKSLPWFN